MNLKFLIVAIIIIILIKFFRDWKRQNLKIQSEGGVRKKYSTLLGYLEGDKKPKIFNLDAESYSFGWITPNADNRFTLIEAFGSVVVKWEFKANIVGQNVNQRKEWRFQEGFDQKMAADKVLIEIEKYSNELFTAPIENTSTLETLLREIQGETLYESFQSFGAEIETRTPNFFNAKYLIEKGAESFLKLYEMIIKKNDLVYEHNIEGETLLHYAVLSNNKQAVKLLITMGADINAKGNKDETPISRAISKNTTEMILYLKEMGAEITKD